MADNKLKEPLYKDHPQKYDRLFKMDGFRFSLVNTDFTDISSLNRRPPVVLDHFPILQKGGLDREVRL